jgi:hypothetical protein
MKRSASIPVDTELATNTYFIRKDEHGIIHRRVKADAHIDIKEAKECEELCLSINDSKKMLTVIDARNFHTLTPEATRYIKTTHNASRAATAIVSENLSQKITASFMKGKTPVKIFSSENEAVMWLRTFK